MGFKCPSDQGKERRRDQSRRYRDRARQRSSLAEPAPPTPHIEPASSVIEAESHPKNDPPPVLPAVSEGERPAEIPEKSCGLPCDRPGCYVLFLPSVASQDQHFCSAPCRQALRRVRQREARLRRRRRGARPLRRPRGGPPQPTAFMSSQPWECHPLRTNFLLHPKTEEEPGGPGFPVPRFLARNWGRGGEVPHG